MILVIDSYDSFTYNLVDILKSHSEVMVKYPDDSTIFKDKPLGIVLSPGPGHPLDNDLLLNIIEHFNHLPILGICLGSQALTCYYGGNVILANEVKHGKIDELTVTHKSALYNDLPQTFHIMRYHSLVSDSNTLPSEMIVTSKTKHTIQSIEHISKPHYGIQYHPESFACEYGKEIIHNFLKIVKEAK